LDSIKKIAKKISLIELKTQLGLGTIADNKLATVIKYTQDSFILEWAVKHRSAKIRAAATENLYLPINLYAFRGLFLTTSTERIAYEKVLHVRRKQLEQLFATVIASYPQLNVIFSENDINT